jgi:transcriptional regulator
LLSSWKSSIFQLDTNWSSRVSKEKIEVWQGTLALMVLRTLEGLGASHGYAIAHRIEEVSGHRLKLRYSTLYPALIKLEQEGHIAGKWGTSDNNRKAKFYSLTAKGRRQIETESRAWELTTSLMAAFLAPEPKAP